MRMPYGDDDGDDAQVVSYEVCMAHVDDGGGGDGFTNGVGYKCGMAVKLGHGELVVLA